MDSGLIDTPMHQESIRIRGGEDAKLMSAVKRKGQPSEVAELILWLLSDSSSFISGTVQVGCIAISRCLVGLHLLIGSANRSSMEDMSVEDSKGDDIRDERLASRALDRKTLAKRASWTQNSHVSCTKIRRQ